MFALHNDVMSQRPQSSELVTLASIALLIFISLAFPFASDLVADPGLGWLLSTAGIFTSVLGLALTIRASRISRKRQQEAEEDPGERLHRRVEAVNVSFKEALSLMADLRRDLDAQQAARKQLITQAKEQQRLLSVNEKQAENIRQILAGETKAAIRTERRQQWMFFALGAAVSIPIGILINLFVP
ncbi:hypothetical protein ACFQ08_02205 [Streptosporangium algeriense]|uniref:Uncharacterized protein n=1 Tax=Streptosporangium algeriense TaxID=1682748 RepID=A0ABW3DLB9_9ACTN